jgi:PTS system nitrogen regulatory IIA component
MVPEKQTVDDALDVLIARGGVLPNIRGASPREVVAAIIDAIPRPIVSAERLLNAVMEREALMSTAVGRGIALPHPRNPLLTRSEDQFVVIGFLEQPVDWNSLDGVPVHTAILIVSASPKQHLRTLSRINFFCREESFHNLLARCAPPAEITALIRTAEQTWR